MKHFLTSILLIMGQLLVTHRAVAQKNTPKDFGFRHLQMMYRGDTVDIILKSKKGEEQRRKPIFLFCQGSLPQPLLKKDGTTLYGVFPFSTDSLELEYHLVIISKPSIPVVVDAGTLEPNFTYNDPKTGKPPHEYTKRNLLDYYVDRNVKVIDYLQKLPYVDNSQIIVAGHSEGSTVAAKLALVSRKVSRLIYAGGNPLGRIMTMIEQNRAIETDTDSTRFAEREFDYWEQVVEFRQSMDDTNGDTHKATYDFSIPPLRYLEKLTIPVLISYGTKDWSAPFNDYLRCEMIRQHKKNFTFKAYIGLEHNFFSLTSTGRPNYEIFNWDSVAQDWRTWAKQK
jgi:dienelactone hydrolase